jgi:hypothetical protein
MVYTLITAKGNALYMLGSLANHSCMSNATWDNSTAEGAVFILTAKRRIQAGEVFSN